MRHDTVESLVLFNHALMAEAEEACARSVVVQRHSLVVQFDWLASSTTNPPWTLSARAVASVSYARYGQIADAAWSRGLSRWQRLSQAFIADHSGID